jgi:hypothetical protein
MLLSVGTSRSPGSFLFFHNGALGTSSTFTEQDKISATGPVVHITLYPLGY